MHFLLWAFAATAFPARAQELLPYSQRSRAYSGYATTVRGDIRTVGMAGAAIGLGDTFIAGEENPAGLALTLDYGDTNFTTNEIHDSHIQTFSSGIRSNNFGVSLNRYPWGFSMGYISPYREGQVYALPDLNGQDGSIDVTTRELHFTGAHLFASNHLSIGMSLILSQSETAIEYSSSSFQPAVNHSYTVSATVGVMGQIYPRIFPALTLRTPMHYSGDHSGTVSPGMPDFFQPVESPGRIGLGLGFIPNRFLRADASSYIVGTTRGAALLKSEEGLVGQYVTVQPRIGLAYSFADFRDFKGSLFLGSYYEVSRIATEHNRYHHTEGVEIKPWIFTMGWGIDTTQGYKNYIFSFGVDVFKASAKLDLIPSIPRSDHAGFFPNPFRLSDAGLARPLQRDWHANGEDINPIKVGLEIPSRVGELPAKLPNKVLESGQDLKQMGKDMLESIEAFPDRIRGNAH